jgi:hypothetical protein
MDMMCFDYSTRILEYHTNITKQLPNIIKNKKKKKQTTDDVHNMKAYNLGIIEHKLVSLETKIAVLMRMFIAISE